MSSVCRDWSNGGLENLSGESPVLERVHAPMSQNQATGPGKQDQTQATAQDPDQGWTTVSEEEHEETKVVFDTIGDEFIGVYLGPRKVETEDSNFIQHRFAVGEERYFVNGNWSLNQGMSHVTRGQLCRIRYTSDKDTNMETPMRVYSVDVKGRRVTSRR